MRNTLDRRLLQRNNGRMDIADSIRVWHGNVYGVAAFMLTVYFVIAQAIHFKMGCFQIGIGYHQYTRLGFLFNFSQRGPFSFNR